jgi:hypothetical protein
MKLLKQSTAATIVVGPVLDSSGAAVTTAVVGDFRIAKNGTTATLSGATVTHDANGYYTIALTTSNTDTVGRLVVYSGNTAHSMATHHWTVLLASVFDALQANATNATGGLVTATAAVTAMAGAISTYAGGAVASVTARVTANTDQWGGVTVTGMPLPTASYTTPPTVASIVTGVYAALPADHTVSGSYGVRLILALNSNRVLQLTGSNHAAADVHEFQADVITATALAASAVTEIQSGLATSGAQTTAQADIDDIQSRLPATLVGGRMDASVGAMQTDTITSAALATSAVAEIQTGLATSANQTLILDRQGFALAVLAGTISDAQTAAETYAITISGSTYTVDFAGLDASGNRSGQTLVKT